MGVFFSRDKWEKLRSHFYFLQNQIGKFHNETGKNRKNQTGLCFECSRINFTNVGEPSCGNFSGDALFPFPRPFSLLFFRLTGRRRIFPRQGTKREGKVGGWREATLTPVFPSIGIRQYFFAGMGNSLSSAQGQKLSGKYVQTFGPLPYFLWKKQLLVALSPGGVFQKPKVATDKLGA